MNADLGCLVLLRKQRGFRLSPLCCGPTNVSSVLFNSPESQIKEMPHEMEQFIIYVVIIELREPLLPKLRSEHSGLRLSAYADDAVVTKPSDETFLKHSMKHLEKPPRPE